MSESSSSGPQRITRNTSSRTDPLKTVQNNSNQKKTRSTKRNRNNNRDTIEETNTTDNTQNMEYENQPQVVIDIIDKGKNKEVTTEQETLLTESSLENNPLGGDITESDWTEVTNKKNKQKTTENVL